MQSQKTSVYLPTKLLKAMRLVKKRDGKPQSHQIKYGLKEFFTKEYPEVLEELNIDINEF